MFRGSFSAAVKSTINFKPASFGKQFACFQSTATSPAAVTVDMQLMQRLRRENEGTPISRVKQALLHSRNDINQAQQWLNEQMRKDGLKKAEKVQNRQAQQGYVILTRRPAALLELNCETDFVARNEVFQRLAVNIVKRFQQNVLESQRNPREVATEMTHGSDAAVKTSITDSIALLGENIQLKRILAMQSNNSGSIIGSFVHGKVANAIDSETELGKIGTIVELDRNANASLAKQLAQHVTGMKPLSVEELLSQPFLFNPDITVDQLLKQTQSSIKQFIRLECGQPES